MTICRDDVIAEAIATTEEVADKVEPYHIMGEPQIPTPPIPSGHTADTYAEEVAWKGLLERLNRKSRKEVRFRLQRKIGIRTENDSADGFFHILFSRMGLHQIC